MFVCLLINLCNKKTGDTDDLVKVVIKKSYLHFLPKYLMSTQSKTMPKIDLQMYVRLVAACFTISAATAFILALLRLWHPQLFYQDTSLLQSIRAHYFACVMMLVTSALGFLNSCVVLNRRSERNIGSNITAWLLIDSIFECSRIVYVFLCHIVLKNTTIWAIYELVISTVQYLVDSFLYCQMILRH